MSGTAQGIQPPAAGGELTSAPSRPPGVPSHAVWVEADGEWQAKQTDESGQLQGMFRSWRADGSPRTIATYQDGKSVGASWTFHPDGSLFSLGCYREGAARGLHHRYGNADPRAERLQSCCVPPGAWQLRQDYSRANLIDRGWFDREGQRLLESGERYPDRPAKVPREAWYNESLGVWEVGVVFEETGFSGTRRRWSTAGVLTLIEDLRRGQRHGEVQCYDDEGALLSVGHYLDGELSGPFWARLMPGELSDPRAESQRGFFLADQAHGVWRAFDGDGGLVQERNLGLTADPGSLADSPVFLNERAPAQTWREAVPNLFSGGRVGEALVAAARASAQARDPADLFAALTHWTLPLGGEAARSEAAQAVERANSDATKAPAVLVDALKRGADPAPILWALAKALPNFDLVALDLVSAALLVAPEFTEPLSTRTLLHAALGDLDSARADVSRLAASSPEQAEFLDLYLRIYFPRFTYWPGDEQLASDAGGVSLSMVRTADELRDVIQRYATRLARLRHGLKKQLRASGLPDGDERPFMIPDLSRLLPDAPLDLARFTFQMSAEEYGGVDKDELEAGSNGASTDQSGAASPSHVVITIDETHEVEPVSTSILRILRQARVDWIGLVWLCWAAGLEAPGLPDQVRPPPAFARAAVLTMERVWRCRDKLKTSGLLALAKGVPGFDWEGTAIDMVPAALADVALDEYIEARAVFSWLCDPANRSPWQDDLRLSEE